MAVITEARLVGDWRRIVGDVVVSHENATTLDDVGITGTVTLTPNFGKGPQGVLADNASLYTAHEIKCRVMWGRLHDNDLNNPWQDLIVAVDGKPIVWTAAFSLTYKWRSDVQAQKINLPQVTFDVDAVTAGEISLTSLIPSAQIPSNYQPYLVSAQASAQVASDAKTVAELSAQAADQAKADATLAKTAAETAKTAAETAATLATTEADRAVGLATAQDQAVADTVLAGGPTTTALSATYGTKGEVAQVETVATNALPRTPMDLRGFTITQADRAHWFRGFAPDGAMIAVMTRSTGGRRLGRSTDNGATWTLLGTPSTDSVSYMWFFGSTWFAHAANALHRSTDDGATWTQVIDLGGIIGQGMARQADGTLWAAEYLGQARIFRSTDDGVTWAMVTNFPNTDGGDGTTIRHLHGIMVASDDSVWVFSGDNNTECGLWKWNGTDFIRQSPAITDAQGAQRWRAVGLAERDGWFYWIQDGASAAGEPPAIVKAHRDDLGGTLTVLAEVPTGGWFIEKLPSGDLVVGSVNEGIGKERDRASRLWMIDQADRVTEVWSAAQAATLSATFPAVRNLAVRPSDGLIAFTINQTDWLGTNGVATVTGYLRPGQKPVAMSRETAPRAYVDTARVWQAVGSTPSPTITNTAYQTVPELTLEVVAQSTRPLMVALSMDIRNNTAGQYSNVRVIAVEKNGGGEISLGAARHGAQIYGQITLTTVFFPPASGDYTIRAEWQATGTSTTESGDASRRRLLVWEP